MKIMIAHENIKMNVHNLKKKWMHDLTVTDAPLCGTSIGIFSYEMTILICTQQNLQVLR